MSPGGMGFNARGLCGTSGCVAASDQKWETWLERLYNLRRDKRGSHERPHKPALLLNIIDLLDRKAITTNEVSLSDELVTTFKRYLEVVKEEDDKPTIENPFFFLSGDKFWQVTPQGQREPLYREGFAAGAPSVAQLRKQGVTGWFDAGLIEATACEQSPDRPANPCKLVNSSFLTLRLSAQRRRPLDDVLGLALGEHFDGRIVGEFRIRAGEFFRDAHRRQARFRRQVGIRQLFKRDLQSCGRGNLAELAERLFLFFGTLGNRDGQPQQIESFCHIRLLLGNSNGSAQSEHLQSGIRARAGKLKQWRRGGGVRPLS